MAAFNWHIRRGSLSSPRRHQVPVRRSQPWTSSGRKPHLKVNAFLCSRVFSFPLINIHFYNFSDIFSSILTPVFSTKTNGATVVSLGFYLQGEFVSSGVSRLLLFFFFSFFFEISWLFIFKIKFICSLLFFLGKFLCFP